MLKLREVVDRRPLPPPRPGAFGILEAKVRHSELAFLATLSPSTSTIEEHERAIVAAQQELLHIVDGVEHAGDEEAASATDARDPAAD
eukprot:CAMPEP_0180789794 /NCGR_PEP_ID=MMETSP1038_2-20121128/52851_1 /TAXON_ID=632150 /ORGANISM="Azadinium spinosum, Strain 3D9" /LENGTH=87 /DNA_ID=CAMNT_0022827661 /DNA_START=30 /DNA_END=290 /DNA_ORIENTATION=-